MIIQGKAALSVLLLSLIIFSCSQHIPRVSEENQIEKDIPVEISESLYYLKDGILHQFSSFSELQSTEPLPWTVQTRISCFLKTGNNIYLGINGHGLAVINIDKKAIEIKTISDTSLFPGRTISNLFARKGEIVCHLYRNTILNTPYSLNNSVTLAAYSPGSESFSILPLSFQEKNPEWEGVELLNDINGNMYITWKKNTPEKTEFYFQMTPGPGFEGKEIKRVDFLNAYAFQNVNAASKFIYDTCRLIMGRSIETSVIHLLLKQSDNLQTLRYTAGNRESLFNGNSKLITVKAYSEAETCYILLPDGKIIWEEGYAKMEFSPPELPENFAYTDFWTNGKLILLSWEEQSFVNTGLAGIYIKYP